MEIARYTYTVNLTRTARNIRAARKGWGRTTGKEENPPVATNLAIERVAIAKESRTVARRFLER